MEGKRRQQRAASVRPPPSQPYLLSLLVCWTDAAKARSGDSLQPVGPAWPPQPTLGSLGDEKGDEYRRAEGEGEENATEVSRHGTRVPGTGRELNEGFCKSRRDCGERAE
ncbi:uncharacterized protein SPSK_05676 [Sporothrix schenckii 1099-18]|uniref:Uncharacterized protein n=1 Tax=Sporothrix schenckii 1099-18 TaxID=1397361 RepID=A0A0F2LXS6_SPOSC|nr:uncharacterized protein SPSK_05676 [Sporothrix schenckii 1099-18]KJR80701.1 hypothetical protein SPSK_05676 [Sporothrix schenckii 1099-18]